MFCRPIHVVLLNFIQQFRDSETESDSQYWGQGWHLKNFRIPAISMNSMLQTDSSFSLTSTCARACACACAPSAPQIRPCTQVCQRVLALEALCKRGNPRPGCGPPQWPHSALRPHDSTGHFFKYTMGILIFCLLLIICPLLDNERKTTVQPVTGCYLLPL